MSQAPVVFMNDKSEYWCIVGKPKGSHGDAKVFLGSFGVKTTIEDALNAVGHKAQKDHEWARKYAGFQFCAARIDLYVELDNAGDLVVRYQDQTSNAF